MSIAAQALTKALQEVLTIFELQKAHADTAREVSSSVKERFDRFMEAYPSGNDSSQEATAHVASLTPTIEKIKKIDLQQDSRLSFRYERAFRDAYDALILLATEPPMQENAKQIAALLREIRLLELDHNPELFTIENLPKPQLGTSEQPESERRQKVADFTISFMGKMDEHVEKVMSNLNAKSQQIEMLLRQALQMAKSLPDESH